MSEDTWKKSIPLSVALRFSEGLALLGVLAMVVALSGGIAVEFSGIGRLSVRSIDRPVGAIVCGMLLRFMLSHPRPHTLAGCLDFWLSRIERAWTRLERCLGRRCRSALDDPADTSIPITFYGVVALFMVYVIGAPTFRYFSCGQLLDFPIFAQSMESSVKNLRFENSVHFLQLVGDEASVDVVGGRVHMFASHFRPALYLLVPFYYVFRHPVSLFFIQGMIVALGMIPAYRLARSYLSTGAAFAASACFCIYPSMVTTSWSFFPSHFAIPLLFWAMWLLKSGRLKLALIPVILLLATKEMLALPVFSLAVYAVFFEKRRLWGIGVGILAVAWFFGSVFWAIPAYAPKGSFGHIHMYAHLGAGLSEILRNMLCRPILVLNQIFSRQTLTYFGRLLAPLSLIPAIAWRLWFLSAPLFLQNVLAGPPGQEVMYRWPGGHWSAAVAPFTFLAFLEGLSWLRTRFGSAVQRRLMVLPFICALVALPPSAGLPSGGRWSDSHEQDLVKQVMADVPKGATIASNLPSVLVRANGDWRPQPFPMGLNNVDYVATREPMDIDHPSVKIPATVRRYLVSLATSEEFETVWRKDKGKSNVSYVIRRRIRGN